MVKRRPNSEATKADAPPIKERRAGSEQEIGEPKGAAQQTTEERWKLILRALGKTRAAR